MNFNRLQVLRRVVECASFSVAAKKMNVTPPAIVQSLKQLEEDLGFKLYSKTNNNLIFTPSALTLYESVKNQIKEIEDAWEIVKTGSISKKITIMGPYAHINKVLIPYLGKTINSKEIFLRVDYGSSSMVNSGLLSGKIEVGIVSSPLSKKIVDSKLIHKEELILVGKRELNLDEEISIVDMSGDLRLFSTWEESNKSLIKKRIIPRLVSTIGGVEGIISMIRSSDLFTVIPKHLIADCLKSGELVNVIPECNRCINNLYVTKLKKIRDGDIDYLYNLICSAN